MRCFVSNALNDTGMETAERNGGSASSYPPIVLLVWTGVFQTMPSVCSTRAAQDKFRYADAAIPDALLSCRPVLSNLSIQFEAVSIAKSICPRRQGDRGPNNRQ
jgi:hypothetical protein